MSILAVALLALSPAEARVFGTPITDAPGTENTPADLSREAMKHIEDYRQDARNEVLAYKSQYGNGISTLITIFNASGADLVYTGLHDFYGHSGRYTPDRVIRNGQWGTFLHVHPTGEMVGSSGALIYNVGGRTSRMDYLMVGWSVPYTGHNNSWCRVEDFDSEYTPTGWDTYQDRIENGQGGQSAYAYHMSCPLGQGSSPALEAVVQRTR